MLISLLLICLLLGCAYKKDIQQNIPAQNINKIINQLEEKNFNFNIKLVGRKTKAEIDGIKIQDRVKIKGVWSFNGEREKITAIGMRNEEFRLKNNKWERISRTSETNPIHMIKLVCSFDTLLVPKEHDNKYYIYEFKPNLLFMDPTLGEEETQGFIFIPINQEVPQKIIAHTKDKQIKWEIEINTIQKGEKIIIPIAKTKNIKIAVAPVKELEKVAEIIKNRFELYGVEQARLIDIKGSIIEMEIVYIGEMPDSIIKALTEIGKIEIYTAKYPSEAQYKNKEVYFIRNNPTNPIYLIKKLDLKIEKIEEKDDFLYLIADKELPQETKIAVVVDDEVIEVLPKVWGNKIKIKSDILTKIKLKLQLEIESVKIYGTTNN